MLKKAVFRDRKLLDAARDMPCQFCGAEDGTVVMAHSNHHDKGMAMKASDCFIAALCFFHHNMVDGRILPHMGQETRELIWKTAHKNTLTRLLELNLLKPEAISLLVKHGSLLPSQFPD